MDLDLRGKHAVVGGGSAGIGLASAIELAKLGARVTLLAHREAPLQAALAQLSQEAGQAHAAVSLDLGDSNALQRLTTEQIDPAGIDVLVNNSGGPPGGTIVDASEEAFLAALRPHLLASHRLVQAVLPGMRARRWGRIVNISSISGVRAGTGRLAYGSSKAALIAMTGQFAIEVAEQGITVNAIAPGFVDTPMIRTLHGSSKANTYLDVCPMHRFCSPAEVSAAVVFFASEQASFVTGQTLGVDGGYLASGLYMRQLFDSPAATPAAA